MSFEPVKVGTIKNGRYIIDPNTEEVCLVLSIDHSKPGKHGAAKARMVLQGLFDGKKREFVSSVDKRVNVPVIDKKYASVTNVLENSIQLMDSETFEYFEAGFPDDPELTNKIKNNFSEGNTFEVEYWKVMDKTKIHAVRLTE
jgi:translation initiation factor 5A